MTAFSRMKNLNIVTAIYIHTAKVITEADKILKPNLIMLSFSLGAKTWE